MECTMYTHASRAAPHTHTHTHIYTHTYTRSARCTTHTHTHTLIGKENKEQRKLLFKELIKFIKVAVSNSRPLRLARMSSMSSEPRFFDNETLMTIIDEDPDSDKTLTHFIWQTRYGTVHKQLRDVVTAGTEKAPVKFGVASGATENNGETKTAANMSAKACAVDGDYPSPPQISSTCSTTSDDQQSEREMQEASFGTSLPSSPITAVLTPESAVLALQQMNYDQSEPNINKMITLYRQTSGNLDFAKEIFEESRAEILQALARMQNLLANDDEIRVKTRQVKEKQKKERQEKERQKRQDKERREKDRRERVRPRSRPPRKKTRSRSPPKLDNRKETRNRRPRSPSKRDDRDETRGRRYTSHNYHDRRESRRYC